jgi:hypothetical protein
VAFKDIGGSITSNIFEILNGQVVNICRLQFQTELIRSTILLSSTVCTDQKLAFICSIPLRNPSDLGSVAKFHVHPILLVALSLECKRRRAKLSSSVNRDQRYTRGNHKVAQFRRHRAPRISLPKGSDFCLLIKRNGVEAHHELESAENVNGLLILTPYLKKRGSSHEGI